MNWASIFRKTRPLINTLYKKISPFIGKVMSSPFAGLGGLGLGYMLGRGFSGSSNTAANLPGSNWGRVLNDLPPGIKLFQNPVLRQRAIEYFKKHKFSNPVEAFDYFSKPENRSEIVSYIFEPYFKRGYLPDLSSNPKTNSYLKARVWGMLSNKWWKERERKAWMDYLQAHNLPKEYINNPNKLREIWNNPLARREIMMRMYKGHYNPLEGTPFSFPNIKMFKNLLK